MYQQETRVCEYHRNITREVHREVQQSQRAARATEQCTREGMPRAPPHSTDNGAEIQKSRGTDNGAELQSSQWHYGGAEITCDTFLGPQARQSHCHKQILLHK